MNRLASANEASNVLESKLKTLNSPGLSPKTDRLRKSFVGSSILTIDTENYQSTDIKVAVERDMSFRDATIERIYKQHDAGSESPIISPIDVVSPVKLTRSSSARQPLTPVTTPNKRGNRSSFKGNSVRLESSRDQENSSSPFCGNNDVDLKRQNLSGIEIQLKQQQTLLELNSQQKSQLKQNQEEYESLMAKCKSTEAQLRIEQLFNESLQKELHRQLTVKKVDISPNNDEVSALKDQISSLTLENVQLLEENAELRHRISVHTEETEKKFTELNDYYTKEMQSLHSFLESKALVLSEANTSLEEMSAELTESKATSAAQMSCIQELTQKLMESEASAAQAASDALVIENFKTEAFEASKLVDTLQASIETLKNEKVEVLEEVQLWKEMMEHSRLSLQSQQTSHEEQMQEIQQQMTAQKKEWDQQVLALNSQLATLKHEKSDVESRFNMLDKLANLRLKGKIMVSTQTEVETSICETQTEPIVEDCGASVTLVKQQETIVEYEQTLSKVNNELRFCRFQVDELQKSSELSSEAHEAIIQELRDIESGLRRERNDLSKSLIEMQSNHQLLELNSRSELTAISGQLEEVKSELVKVQLFAAQNESEHQKSLIHWRGEESRLVQEVAALKRLLDEEVVKHQHEIELKNVKIADIQQRMDDCQKLVEQYQLDLEASELKSEKLAEKCTFLEAAILKEEERVEQQALINDDSIAREAVDLLCSMNPAIDDVSLEPRQEPESEADVAAVQSLAVLAELRSDLQESEEENSELRGNMQELKSELASLKLELTTSNQNWMESRAELECDRDRLVGLLAAKDCELMAFEEVRDQKVLALTQEIAGLKSTLSVIESDRTRLQDSIQVSLSSSRSFDDAEDRESQSSFEDILKAKVKYLKQINTQLESNQSMANQKVSELQKALDQARNEVIVLEGRSNKADDQLQSCIDLQEQICSLTIALQEKNDELSRVQVTFAAAAPALDYQSPSSPIESAKPQLAGVEMTSSDTQTSSQVTLSDTEAQTDMAFTSCIEIQTDAPAVMIDSLSQYDIVSEDKECQSEMVPSVITLDCNTQTKDCVVRIDALSQCESVEVTDKECQSEETPSLSTEAQLVFLESFDSITQENTQLKQRVDELIGVANSIKSKAKTHSIQLKEKLIRCEEHLLAKTEELALATSRLVEVDAQMEALQADLSSKCCSLTETETQLLLTRQALGESESSLLTSERMVKSQESKLTQLSTEIETLIIERDAAIENFTCIQKELLATKAHHRQETEELELLIGTLKSGVNVFMHNKAEKLDSLESVNDELQDRLTKDHDRLIQLATEKSTLLREIEDLKDENQNATILIATLKEQSLNVESKLALVQAELAESNLQRAEELSKWSARVTDLSGRLEAQEATLEATCSQRDFLTEQMRALMIQLECKCEESDLMQSQCVEWKANAHQLSCELQQQDCDIETETSQLMERITQVESQLASKHMDLQEALQQVRDLDASLTGAERESELQQELIVSLQREHSNLRDQLTDMIKFGQNSSLDVDGINSTVHRISEMLAVRLAKPPTPRIITVRSAPSVPVQAPDDTRVAVLESELRIAHMAIATIENESKQQMEALKDLLQSTKEQRDSMSEQLEQLKTSLDERTREIERLSGVASAVVVSEEQLMTYKSEVASLTERIKTLKDQSKTRAAQSIAKIRDLQTELTSKELEVSQIRLRVADIEKAMAVLAKAKEESERETAEAKTRALEMESESLTLSLQVEEMQATIARKSAEVLQLRDDLALTQSSTSQVVDVSVYTKQIEDLTSKLTAMKQDAKNRALQSIERIKSLQAELNVQTGLSVEYEQKISTLEAALLEAEKEKLNAAANGGSVPVNKTVTLLYNECCELKSAMSEVKTHSEKKTVEIKRLNIALKQVTNQHDRLKRSLEKLAKLNISVQNAELDSHRSKEMLDLYRLCMDEVEKSLELRHQALLEQDLNEDFSGQMSTIQQTLQKTLAEIQKETPLAIAPVDSNGAPIGELSPQSGALCKQLYERMSDLNSELQKKEEECFALTFQLTEMTQKYEGMKLELTAKSVTVEQQHELTTLQTQCQDLRQHVADLQNCIVSLQDEQMSLVAVDKTRKELLECATSENKRLSLVITNLEDSLSSTEARYEAAMNRVNELEELQIEWSSETQQAKQQILSLSAQIKELEVKKTSSSEPWEIQAEAQRLHELRIAFAGFVMANSLKDIERHGQHICTILRMSNAQSSAILNSMQKLAPIIIAYSSLESITNDFSSAFENMVFGTESPKNHIPHSTSFAVTEGDYGFGTVMNDESFHVDGLAPEQMQRN